MEFVLISKDVTPSGKEICFEKVLHPSFRKKTGILEPSSTPASKLVYSDIKYRRNSFGRHVLSYVLQRYM